MKTLISSDEQWALAETEGLEPYLFRSQSGRIEFVVIEEELEQLNDYCVVAQEAAKDSLDTHKKRKVGILTKEDKYIHPEIGDVSDEVLLGIEDVDIPKWEHIYTFLSHATALLLLHVFVEKSLKQLCLNLKPENALDPRQDKGKSMVDSYIMYIRDVCGYRFQEPEGSEDLRASVRKIRNCFAHGDWDSVEIDTEKVNLKDSFMIISKLFIAIEGAVEL